jgi:hypothetical protein
MVDDEWRQRQKGKARWQRLRPHQLDSFSREAPGGKVELAGCSLELGASWNGEGKQRLPG